MNRQVKFQRIIDFIRDAFHEKEGFIPLHEPRFSQIDKDYVADAIDSTFVSSIGAYVNRFEKDLEALTSAQFAVATVNGTAALHIALKLAGVETGTEVITQALTFVATANAIAYCNAKPIFIDVDKDSLGLSPDALHAFLTSNCTRTSGHLVNKKTGNRISACLPMHTFGMPNRIEEIVEICANYNLNVVEDAAESLGSYYHDKHTGTFGKLGTFSFNGNKTITSGGGGAIITNNEELSRKAKYLTTTAKVPHAWDYEHDELGYNYRMPNLNAALACAQLSQLDTFLTRKLALTERYYTFFNELSIAMIRPIEGSKSNNWLNAILLEDRDERDAFLKTTNNQGIMTRPLWKLMCDLPMYKNCQTDSLKNSRYLEERIVNIPSSVISSLT